MTVTQDTPTVVLDEHLLDGQAPDEDVCTTIGCRLVATHHLVDPSAPCGPHFACLAHAERWTQVLREHAACSHLASCGRHTPTLVWIAVMADIRLLPRHGGAR